MYEVEFNITGHKAKTLKYDENIYVKKEQTTALFACENDNDEIQEEYEKLGGKEKLLALSETSSYSCDEEEEVNENEEDF